MRLIIAYESGKSASIDSPVRLSRHERFHDHRRPQGGDTGSRSRHPFLSDYEARAKGVIARACNASDPARGRRCGQRGNHRRSVR